MKLPNGWRPSPWILGPQLAALAVTPAAAVPVAVVAGIIGAAASSFVAIAVTALVNIAISLVASKLINAIAGKPQQQRQAAVTTLAIGESPRVAIFGTAAVGGTLMDAFNWGGKYGTDYECMLIDLADHRSEGLVEFYVNDQQITYPAGGFSGGTVPDQGAVKYGGQLQVWFLNGTPTQTLPGVVTNGGWSTTGSCGGLTMAVVVYKADDPKSKNPVWSGGRPNFLWVVKGLRCYDPRKDSSVGGSGPHRWNDPTTREWTDNAAVCRYNWVRGIYAKDQVANPAMLLVGRGLSSLEAPETNVFAYANLCDEDVPLQAGGSEKRYRLGGVAKSDEKYTDTEKMFADAMAGVILQPGGSVEVEPGHARAPTFAITDDDLIVGSKVAFADFRSVADNAWVNTVIPRYSEPTQKWQEHGAPVRRASADVVADGAPREATLTLEQVSSGTQAQRCGEIQRRLGRLTRTATVTLGPRFCGIEEGDWGTWASTRHTKGIQVTWRVEAYAIDATRQITLTLREIAASVYDWSTANEGTSDVAFTPTPPVDPAYLTDFTTPAAVDALLISNSYTVDYDPSDALLQSPADASSITIEAHSRVYSDKTLALNGATLTTDVNGAAFTAATEYNVYYDDATRSNLSPAYQATTVQTDAVNSSAFPARHYVGSIVTSASGATTPSGGGGASPAGYGGTHWGSHQTLPRQD